MSKSNNFDMKKFLRGTFILFKVFVLINIYLLNYKFLLTGLCLMFDM